MIDITANYSLIIEAEKRLAENKDDTGIPESQVLYELGISPKEIEDADDPVIE